MTTDLPGRLLDAVTNFLPRGREQWGRAMRAEMAALDARGERWRFAGGCLRVAVTQFHLLRATLHLAVVLGALGTVFAWAATIDYRPLAWPLDAMVSVLAVVCWQARRTAMLGPVGDGATAGLLRGGGYLLAGAIAALCLLHARPATGSEAESGIGLLVAGVIVAAYALGLVLVCARSAAATTRLRLTAVGCGTVAALTWLLAVTAVPPIPASTGSALALTATAAFAALSMNLGTARRALLAALLSGAVTLALIFCAVVLLARYGPDALIPALTPHALPANRVAESRIEIIDPYVLVFVLGGLAATALGAAAVSTRRPTTARRPSTALAALTHPAGA
ncbi:hypothetical protein [Actinoplanes sp. NPDC051411]|uniref:hypothetical protein n=1 Tax=Actinoplanes sp. NPDC051411 TaxID=3155522 RepID=UPI00341A471B